MQLDEVVVKVIVMETSLVDITAEWSSPSASRAIFNSNDAVPLL
jgi:hypothetical protein